MNYNLLDEKWFISNQNLLRYWLNIPIIGKLLRLYVNIPRRHKIIGIFPNCIHFTLPNGKRKYIGYGTDIISKRIVYKFSIIFWLIHLADIPIDIWIPKYSFNFDSFINEPQESCGVTNISCDAHMENKINSPTGQSYTNIRQFPINNSNFTDMSRVCGGDIKVLLRSWNSVHVYEYIQRILVSFEVLTISIVPGSITNSKLYLYPIAKYNDLDAGQDLIITRWVLNDYLETYHNGSYGNPVPYIREEEQGNPSPNPPWITVGDWTQYVTSFFDGIITWNDITIGVSANTALDGSYIETAINNKIPVGYMLMLNWDWDWMSAAFNGSINNYSGFVFGSAEGANPPYIEFDYTPGVPITSSQLVMMI